MYDRALEGSPPAPHPALQVLPVAPRLAGAARAAARNTGWGRVTRRFVTAEGVLREALIKLWEQARNRGVVAIGTLKIRMFEAGDGFRLLGAVGALPGAEKVVTMRGGYETSADGAFELDFRGPVPDAQPVREFLEPQLRDARTNSLEIGFQLRFADGLPMQGDAAEQLTERQTRLGSAAAYVSRTGRAAILMARLPRISPIATPDSVPRYEIRIAGRGPGNGEDEIWQLPARDTPRVAASARIAGLRGRNLELVEHRVLKRLAQAGVKPQSGLNGRKCGYAVTEDVALTLGLLFRTLAPMRSRDNMRAVAAYWLGMAMYRRHPRRVLTALRFLLTEPRRRAAG